MGGIFITNEGAPPSVSGVSPFAELVRYVWHGWDGSSWLLTCDPASVAFWERDGRDGLLFPPIDNQTDEGAALDGSVWLGYRATARTITWPLFVVGSSPSDYRAEHSRFFDSLRPGKLGTLEVLASDGRSRFIDLRYSKGGEGQFSGSTFGQYWSRHTVELIAPDPYYYGTTLTRVFTNPAATSFFGSGAPPFTIAATDTLSSASLTNPGDVDVWPTWRVDGPITTADLTLDGSTIEIDLALTAGQWLEIVTDPAIQTIKDQGGVNRWASMGAVAFGRVPAGSTVPLGITVSGATTATKVTVTFTPKYWRAW